MKKIKITIDNFSEQESKEIAMEADSCKKVGKQNKVDYLFAEKENPSLNYFEVGMSGKIKILATSGKVELVEEPLQENVLQTWSKA